MKRFLIALGFVGWALIFFAVVTAARKPALRTWELGTAPKGRDHFSLPFRTPKRDSQPAYWSYHLGLVLPIDQDFDLRGRVILSSAKKRKTTTIEFDPEAVTRSSWLQNEVRISYLLGDDFGMRDEEDYRLEIHFEEPLSTEVGVVLHFLSHTDPKQGEAGKAERASGAVPAPGP